MQENKNESADVRERPEGRPEEARLPEELSILPSKNAVLFPSMILPLSVSGQRWVSLVNEAAAGHRPIGIFAQRNPEEEASPDNLFGVGTAGIIGRMLRLPDGTVQALVQGMSRIRLEEIIQTDPYLRGRVAVLQEQEEKNAELDALQRNLRAAFRQMVSLSPTLPDEMASLADGIPETGRLADFIASVVNIPTPEKQDLLETLDVAERVRKLLASIYRELEVLEISRQIQSQIKERIDKTQREYYLREQLRAIQRELGEVDERQAEVAEYQRRTEEAKMPPEALKETEREMDRLRIMPPASPEYGMIRSYLDWMTSLPWSASTEDHLDIAEAKRILDEDHYDLERVKQRILEFLAVRKLKQDMRGPILCFVGPPGVGKTSLGQSIARAMGRHFIRMSLGGIRDEAEIRGHRRTYIGALPGRIIQGIRRAGSNNPVFMLDEIDKLTVSFQGDPAAALLEVLDPAQNFAFQDLYLGVPFDLSKVLFIATGNVLETIPAPLLDRMEVLRLAGYTEEEKLQIAKRFLIPKQVRENGVPPKDFEIVDDALRLVIDGYTREAGVRNLEREIGNICRKAALQLAEQGAKRTVVIPDEVPDYLGPRRFRRDLLLANDEIGVATGLAWTPFGGDVLFIEATIVPGRGNLTITGQLGEVMRESAMAALTYARSRSPVLGVDEDFYQKFDVHIHVPAGAVPKDGPSAGITIALALISAITKRPVKKEVAMTGEITLRGKVLPVGGIKEKVLAAHRAGAEVVVLPKENERDLVDVPEETKKELKLVLVDHMDQVLGIALRPETAEEPIRLAVIPKAV